MRDCYCDYCGHEDKKECASRECDCCGEMIEYEHDSDYEEKED